MWRFYTDTDDAPAPWCEGWASASDGHVPLVHRLCLHASHLGEVQQGIDGRHRSIIFV